MTKVAWDYIVQIKFPADLKGLSAGKLPAWLLVKTSAGAKLHWRAADAYEALAEAAKAVGITLKPSSLGDMYRDYAAQEKEFYRRYQTEVISGASTRTFLGKKWYLKKGFAPLAPPGGSNHNWGLAIDLADASNPKRQKWLIENLPKFGFSWEL